MYTLNALLFLYKKRKRRRGFLTWESKLKFFSWKFCFFLCLVLPHPLSSHNPLIIPFVSYPLPLALFSLVNEM